MTAAVEAALTADRELAQSGLGLLGTLARRLSTLRQLAPYAVIELVLPGGSLIALLLWLYRRYRKRAAATAASRTAAPDYA